MYKQNNNLIFLFIIYLFLISNVTGQNLENQIKVEKGEVFKVKTDEKHRSFATTQDGDFFTIDIQLVDRLSVSLSNMLYKVKIYHFNSNLTLINSNEFKLNFDKVNHSFIECLFLNDQLYLITKAHLSKKDEEKTFFFNRLDRNTLEITDTYAIPISEYPDQENISKSLLKNDSKFLNYAENVSYRFSKDKSKLIIKNPVPKYKNSQLYFSFKVYDLKNNFHEMWEYGFFREEGKNKFDVEEFIVNNDGEAALLFKEFGEKINDGFFSYNYQFQSITTDGKLNFDQQLIFKKDYLTNLKISFDQNDRIILIGLYYEKERGISGRYFAALNPTEQNTFFEKNYSNNVALSNYLVIDSLVLMDNGKIVMVAEYKRTSNPEVEYKMVFRKSIEVISFSELGEIEWSKRILKNQQTMISRSLYTSYHLSVVNNKLYFFHIDDPENLEQYEVTPKKWNLSKKSKVLITEIDEKGNLRNTAMLDFEEDKTVLIPELTEETINKTILGYSKWGNKARFYQFKID